MNKKTYTQSNTYRYRKEPQILWPTTKGNMIFFSCHEDMKRYFVFLVYRFLHCNYILDVPSIRFGLKNGNSKGMHNVHSPYGETSSSAIKSIEKLSGNSKVKCRIKINIGKYETDDNFLNIHPI